MAKSALQRKRESLERKRAAIEAMPEATRNLPAEPFFEFLDKHHNGFNVHMALDVGGLPLPDFSDDRNPKSTTGEIERGEYLDYGKYQGSIGRAELMVAAWIDAAQELASIINEYKKEAVTAALSGLENTDLNDPAVRKKALAESARLHKIRERLDRATRVTIPTYEVKGI
ncbi:hypothetical protein NKJ87_17840 [Mesorhizobium sp. M0027]|uniref:hypothetical protein n=1 Tax=Mesorhizobium sp. M0027 TaxID=2956848 RepID=UPI003334F81E